MQYNIMSIDYPLLPVLLLDQKNINAKQRLIFYTYERKHFPIINFTKLIYKELSFFQVKTIVTETDKY